MNKIKMTVGRRKIAVAERPLDLDYWKEALYGASPATFGTYAPGRANSGMKQKLAGLSLDQKLAESVRKGCNNDNRAMNILLTSVMTVLVRAYTGADDILIGNPANPDSQLTQFTPVRIRLDEEDTLQTLLKKMNKVISTDSPHYDFPIDLVGPKPVVYVALSELHRTDSLAELDGEIGFLFFNNQEEIRLEIYTNPVTYSAEAAHKIGCHFIRLLELAVRTPAISLYSLDLSLESDKALIRTVNSTAADFPQTTLTELFARTMARLPDKIAVYTPRANYTYAEFHQASSHIARLLLQEGVSSGSSGGNNRRAFI